MQANFIQPNFQAKPKAPLKGLHWLKQVSFGLGGLNVLCFGQNCKQG